MTNRDIKYFNVAKAMCELSDFNRVHVGCVVVYNKQIISVGCNVCKTHPIQAKYNQYRPDYSENWNHSSHAEIIALAKIRHLRIDWNKVSIYTYRQHKLTGEKMISKPCPACKQLILDMGIKKVYYSINGGYAHEFSY